MHIILKDSTLLAILHPMQTDAPPVCNKALIAQRFYEVDVVRPNDSQFIDTVFHSGDDRGT